MSMCRAYFRLRDCCPDLALWTTRLSDVLPSPCPQMLEQHIILSSKSGWKANAAWEGKAAETAHQQCNNMTDDRPRGKSRPASRSACRACQRARCSYWKDIIPSLASGSCWASHTSCVLCPYRWPQLLGEVGTMGESSTASTTLHLYFASICTVNIKICQSAYSIIISLHLF